METLTEAEKRREKVCKKCAYWKYAGAYSHCQYITETGTMRPCKGSECVARGVFRKRKKRKNPVLYGITETRETCSTCGFFDASYRGGYCRKGSSSRKVSPNGSCIYWEGKHD